MSTHDTAQPAVMAAASLFSAGDRTSLERRGHSESEYAFLDRSARGPVARIREVLDQWYSELPVAAMASIRSRFAERHPGHHLGAFWELYLHESFRRLGFDIDIDAGSEDPAKRRPDLALAVPGDPSLYVEATAVLGDSVLGKASVLTGDLREAVDCVQAPDFFVQVAVEEPGRSTPGRRQVTEPLQKWLGKLDPDEVLAGFNETGKVPSLVLEFDSSGSKLSRSAPSTEARPIIACWAATRMASLRSTT
jgi:hypothetical protein